MTTQGTSGAAPERTQDAAVQYAKGKYEEYAPGEVINSEDWIVDIAEAFCAGDRWASREAAAKYEELVEAAVRWSAVETEVMRLPVSVKSEVLAEADTRLQMARLNLHVRAAGFARAIEGNTGEDAPDV